MRYPWCSANMKQCRPDSPTILLRSLFVPDPSPHPPSLPQHHYIFSVPSPRPCSHSQPSIIVARNNMDLFPPWLSLEVFRIWKIKSAIFPGILTFILQGQKFCFFYHDKMKVNRKYVLVLFKLCTFYLGGKTIFSALLSALLSIAVLYARSAAGGETFHSKLWTPIIWGCPQLLGSKANTFQTNLSIDIMHDSLDVGKSSWFIPKKEEL